MRSPLLFRVALLLLLLLLFFFFFTSQAVAPRKLLQLEWEPIRDLNDPSIVKVIHFAVSEQSRTHGGLAYTLISAESGEQLSGPEGAYYLIKLKVKPQDEDVGIFQASVYESKTQNYLQLIFFMRL
ncbi:hypothetical protein C4D60_Mb06t26070 [Musa balbisiana]|uniref:Cystatin domain-containing protein n=1 Tax=Musa balbisiana TaxID=52838 RepID=A0A4S8IQV6_MUSBA|nr:hypothetical protein C4D60_Mb06t26070 [Musa balbisiana]